MLRALSPPSRAVHSAPLAGGLSGFYCQPRSLMELGAELSLVEGGGWGRGELCETSLQLPGASLSSPFTWWPWLGWRTLSSGTDCNLVRHSAPPFPWVERKVSLYGWAGCSVHKGAEPVLCSTGLPPHTQAVSILGVPCPTHPKVLEA